MVTHLSNAANWHLSGSRPVGYEHWLSVGCEWYKDLLYNLTQSLVPLSVVLFLQSYLQGEVSLPRREA